jgi:hypothetical protein
MLSIIICHRNLDLLAKLKPNIEETIGVNYELIVIDNSSNQYSIFEAYNIGVSKSNYDLICFTHEDVLFHTQNWGQKVVGHFMDSSIGMIGVIGANVFPKSPSPWWSSEIVNNHLVNNIQHWQHGAPKTKYQQILSQTNNEIVTKQYNNPTQQNIIDAVVVDGLWFCIRKSLFTNKAISFDSKTFKGFHCYDSDISLQVKQHARVCVVYDILIEHFQQGNINKSWFESVILLNRKWRNSLPIFEKEINEKLYALYEWETLRTFVYWMQANQYTEQEIKELITEVYPFLKIDQQSKTIANELINRAKYGKHIAKVMNKLYKILS